MNFKPWLWLSVKWAHKLSPIFLKTIGYFREYQTLTWRPFTWRGLEFTNPLGIAGGADKNADLVQDFWTLGTGFVEVGTITPKPQTPNPGVILGRENSTQTLWNKMGFPNRGVDYAKKRLKKLKQPHFTPIFANIGRNRGTTNERAHEDYLLLMHELSGLADVFVINISSPNTPDLRKLLEPENLSKFLNIILEDHQTPVLLKLSPDISDEELFSILDISYDCGIDGWVLTNTTTKRDDNSKFPNEGGLSGQPLAKKSKEILEKTIKHLGTKRNDKLIVSVGGVTTADEVFERLELGANLVQTYSGLVFEGPFFFKRTYENARLKYY